MFCWENLCIGKRNKNCYINKPGEDAKNKSDTGRDYKGIKVSKKIR